jgi:pimeloyl-ACP methyl ester carboxylesterase
MPAAPAADEFSSIFVSAADGLKLHARCIGPPALPGMPVVCLPGLTRTAEDFDVLARALAADASRPRRVLALDYRGRGRSGYDPDPRNYSVPVEVADIIAVITALKALPAIFIGTSRGGILAMVLASIRRDAVAAVVLNDIGPVIEPAGLMRIKGYVGNLPQPKDYDDAAAMLRRLFGAQFPTLGEQDWLASARRAFKDDNGRLVQTYDRNLAQTLADVSPDMPPPTLWPQFDALAGLPVMLIRGALSDLLSEQTAAAMRARHDGLEVFKVAHQGHAPLLADSDTIGRIAGFVGRIG